MPRSLLALNGAEHAPVRSHPQRRTHHRISGRWPRCVETTCLLHLRIETIQFVEDRLRIFEPLQALQLLPQLWERGVVQLLEVRDSFGQLLAGRIHRRVQLADRVNSTVRASPPGVPRGTHVLDAVSARSALPCLGSERADQVLHGPCGRLVQVSVLHINTSWNSSVTVSSQRPFAAMIFIMREPGASESQSSPTVTRAESPTRQRPISDRWSDPSMVMVSCCSGALPTSMAVSARLWINEGFSLSLSEPTPSMSGIPEASCRRFTAIRIKVPSSSPAPVQ